MLASDSPVAAQEPDANIDAVVETIFAELTPAERVGQLFMVSFDGNNVIPGSDIGELIQVYRVGGVTVSASAKNFANNQTAPDQVLSLTNGLQSLARKTPPAGVYTATLTTTVSIALVGPQPYHPTPLLWLPLRRAMASPTPKSGRGWIVCPARWPWALPGSGSTAADGQVVGHDLSLLVSTFCLALAGCAG